MRFLFVDKITDYTESKICGSKFFAEDHALVYQNSGMVGQVAPGVISEAIGQLVSWLAISRKNFGGRPVFLFADRIEVNGPVPAGSNVNLEAHIFEMDDETLVFGGKAYVDGKLVHTVHTSSGYFMPLADMEDPLITRQRFSELCGSGLKIEGESGEYDFSSLIDDTLSCDATSIRCRKRMQPSEPFFADHFPRFPVTPIVMINEMIGEATRRLLATQELGDRLQIMEVSDVKIKNFLRPDETAEINVKLVESADIGDKRCIQTIAELIKDGKRILRGRYHYQVGGSI